MVVTLGQQYNVIEEKPTVILYAYINRHARTLKAAIKNVMRLGTAQFCYIGSRIGWVAALQAGVLTVNWRGGNETTIMFKVFTEVVTGRHCSHEEGERMRGQRGPSLKS